MVLHEFPTSSQALLVGNSRVEKLINQTKNVFQTNQRYEEDDLKRAADASRDTRFSAILAIVSGIAIALFFIFIVVIVPTFA